MKTFISFSGIGSIEWKPMPRPALFIAAVPEGYEARFFGEQCVAVPKDGMAPPLVLVGEQWEELKPA